MRLPKGGVKGVGLPQVGLVPFTELAWSARQVDEFDTLTSSADATEVRATNCPFATKAPPLAMTAASPKAMLLPSAPIRFSARSA